MAYKKGTDIYKKIKKMKDPSAWLTGDGVMNKAFPMGLEKPIEKPFVIEGDLADISENQIDYNPKKSPFNTVGIMINDKVYSSKGIPNLVDYVPYHDHSTKTIRDILVPDDEVPSGFYLTGDAEKWERLKGAKKEKRRMRRRRRKRV